ncbi:hypothetical protein [Candidatus Nanohalococcus occultus]|uniref:hypothetical protein n=1 Tax=Candidatus Nanohalococcus occultus TaxID=2978047 RepID=UPI0039E1635E
MSDYIDYVGVFSLSILAVSASYFLDLNNTLTLITLVLIPASMGFTAYISKDGFSTASLSSVICLFLAGFNPLVTLVAGVVAVVNPLVSVFAGGDSFKDIFNSAALPLLLAGLIVGSGVYGATQYDQSIQTTVEDTTVDLVSAQADLMLENTEMISGSQDRQVEAMKNVSRTSVLLTERTVLNNMSGRLDQAQLMDLRNSFDYAENSVPGRFNTTSQSQSGSPEQMISDQVESGLRELITPRTMIAVIPLLGLGFYSLSPFVGLLSGAFGVIFREILERMRS